MSKKVDFQGKLLFSATAWLIQNQSKKREAANSKQTGPLGEIISFQLPETFKA